MIVGRAVLEGTWTSSLLQCPELWLQATCMRGVPVVSAVEFARFVGQWQRYHPGGVWSSRSVVVESPPGCALTYTDRDGRRYEWPVVAVCGGVQLYSLCGLEWRWDHS